MKTLRTIEKKIGIKFLSFSCVAYGLFFLILRDVNLDLAYGLSIGLLYLMVALLKVARNYATATVAMVFWGIILVCAGPNLKFWGIYFCLTGISIWNAVGDGKKLYTATL